MGSAWDALRRLLTGHGHPHDADLVDHQWDLPERVGELLADLGLPHLPPERPATELSGGEATRVILAGLLLGQPDLLLLDEPTNHLDRPARGALFRRLDEWEGGLVVVSHDRELLRRVDRTVEVGSGTTPHLVTGALDLWMESRALREGAARRRLERARQDEKAAKRDADRARERQARRSSSGTRKAKKGGMPKVLLGARKRRAEATSGRVAARGDAAVRDAREGVRHAAEQVVERRRIRVPLPPTGLPASREVICVQGFGVEGLFGPLDFVWTGPVRIALTGPNGSGKSTLLRILARSAGVAVEVRPHSGTVTSSLPVGSAALLEQWLPHRSERSILHHLRSLHPDVTETRIREVLDRFLFRDAAVATPLAGLSEGERVRVALAGILAGPRPPSLLLLDEPTNQMDLESVDALEELLGEYDGVLVVASHDAEFLDGVGCAEEVPLG